MGLRGVQADRTGCAGGIGCCWGIYLSYLHIYRYLPSVPWPPLWRIDGFLFFFFFFSLYTVFGYSKVFNVHFMFRFFVLWAGAVGGR